MAIKPNESPQIIYQADPVHVDTVNSIRKKLHGLCKEKLLNRHVLVKTVDGQEYEGVIVFVDEGQIYLSLARDEALEQSFARYAYPSPWGPYPPVNPTGAILPLVLFNLLTISLLY